MGAEKESLKISLDRHRDAVLWKLEGLSDADLRRSMTPSGTTLLGLVKHLGAVEYGWFCRTFVLTDRADALRRGRVRCRPAHSSR
jgi:hypothetical protein